MKTYFESTNVKVFPCAYRGNNNTTIFDPEARLNTEFNLTHTTDRNHESYIIGLESSDDVFTLKFVIAGYRFELSNCTYSDFYDSDTDKIAKAYIKLTNCNLYSDTKTTTILGNWIDDAISTDYYLDYDNVFYGLYLSTTKPSIENIYELEIFTSRNDDETLNLNYNKFLPQIGAGNNSNKTAIILGGHPTTTTFTFTNPQAGTDYNGKQFDINATGNFAILSGGDSLASGNKAIATGTNTIAEGAQAISGGSNTLAKGTGSIAFGTATVASGNHSYAHGENTQATGPVAHAEGTSTIASGYGAHADGNSTQAKGNWSYAHGNGTIANAAYQFVLGTFNNPQTNTIFEIGNGTSASKRSNVIEVGDSTNKIIKLNYATSIDGALTQTGNSNQVIFNGNVDANKGLDVTGEKFTLDDHSATFGSNATDCTTIEKGNITSTGSITANTGLNIGIAVNNVYPLSIDSDGKIKTSGGIETDGLISANNGLEVASGKDFKLLGQKSTSTNYALQIDTDGLVTNSNLAVTSPTTGAELTTEFIDTISQASNGKISATKKKFTLEDGGQGAVKLNNTTINITNLGTAGSPTFSSITTTNTIQAGGLLSALAGLTVASGQLTLVEQAANLWSLKINSNGVVTKNNLSSVTSTAQSQKTTRFVKSISQTAAGQVSYITDYFTVTNGGQGIIKLNDSSINITNLGTSGSPTFNKVTITSIASSGGNFAVDSSGNVTALTYNAKSDKRLKENIVEYIPEKSILDLPICKYDFIDGPKNQIGCIAQDLQKLFPELVNEDQNGYLSIQENKLIYLLIDEVKKLKKQIKKLEDK